MCLPSVDNGFFPGGCLFLSFQVSRELAIEYQHDRRAATSRILTDVEKVQLASSSLVVLLLIGTPATHNIRSSYAERSIECRVYAMLSRLFPDLQMNIYKPIHLYMYIYIYRCTSISFTGPGECLYVYLSPCVSMAVHLASSVSLRGRRSHGLHAAWKFRGALSAVASRVKCWLSIYRGSLGPI